MTSRVWVTLALLWHVPAIAPVSAQTPAQMLEIRVYTLKPGIRDAFHSRFLTESLPLLRTSGVEVVAFGPSLHDADSYYLMRAFPSVEARDQAEAAFYGSRAWLDG